MEVKTMKVEFGFQLHMSLGGKTIKTIVALIVFAVFAVAEFGLDIV